MADLALVTADKLNVGTSGPNLQHTLPAAGTMTAGAPVYIDTAGKFAVAIEGTGTNYTGVFGLATRSVAAAGEPVTAIRRGFVDGLNVASLAFGTKLYLSTNSAKIADTIPGTSNAGLGVLGRVVPAWSVPLGTAADKIVLLEVTG